MSNIVEFIYKLTDKISAPLQTIVKNTQRVEEQNRRTKVSTESLGSSVLKFGAAYFSVQQLIRNGKLFLNLGLDMEQTRIKFDSLTGSLERGNYLINQITDLSKKSPFSLNKLLGNAQTLLAYGINAEKVTDTLRILGDISMGDKNRLNGLTLAFAQMSSTGRLTGQDLLQMINQGFNPLLEISERTGKSVSKLRDEMSKGLVTSQMVENAFRSATDEGGRFYQMSEKIASRSGVGKIETGLAIIQDKLTSISERLNPVISKIADYFLSFANNFDMVTAAAWKVLIPVRALGTGIFNVTKFFVRNRAALISLVAIYTLYRLALWSTAIAMKGWTLSSMLQYKWLLLVEKAQALLNATLLKNPFAFALLGISLVVGALIMMRKRTREATDGLGEAQKQAASFYAQERTQLDLLFNKLKKTNPASAERKRIIDEIARAYPELNKQQLADIKNARDLTATYETLIAVIGKRAKAHAYEAALQSQYEKISEVDMIVGELKPGASEDERINYARQLLSWTNEGGISRQWIKDMGLNKKNLHEYIKGIENARKLQNSIFGMDLSADSSGSYNFSGSSGDSATDISSLTGSGAKATNVNITFRNLIEFLNMYPATVTEGVEQISDELIEGLLRVINSGNRIASR